jgi:uncharacterized LabA/DUF88 family protein
MAARVPSTLEESTQGRPPSWSHIHNTSALATDAGRTQGVINRRREWISIVDEDFRLDLRQKGVDMRIGLDIASFAYKRQINQLVLISGDSDFVPAAKLARRERIDFVLDPMW